MIESKFKINDEMLKQASLKIFSFNKILISSIFLAIFFIFTSYLFFDYKEYIKCIIFLIIGIYFIFNPRVIFYFIYKLLKDKNQDAEVNIKFDSEILYNENFYKEIDKTDIYKILNKITQNAESILRVNDKIIYKENNITENNKTKIIKQQILQYENIKKISICKDCYLLILENSLIDYIIIAKNSFYYKTDEDFILLLKNKTKLKTI